MDWDLPDPFTLEVCVGEADIDGLRHTNNVVYVRWCEQAAWQHSCALGLDLACYQALDRGMAIRRSEFDYLNASGLGDRVSVGTWITAWDGKLTMERRFQLLRLTDGVTLLRARMDFACIELSSGRPRRLPREFIAGYGPAVIGA